MRSVSHSRRKMSGRVSTMPRALYCCLAPAKKSSTSRRVATLHAMPSPSTSAGVAHNRAAARASPAVTAPASRSRTSRTAELSGPAATRASASESNCCAMVVSPEVKVRRRLTPGKHSRAARRAFLRALPLTEVGARTTIAAVRAKSLLIGAAATAGFVVIARLTMFPPAHDEVAAPAPLPLPSPPTGPEAVPAAGEISVLTLLGEMADLMHLARLPRPQFAAGQAASTDRRSRSPDDGESWFANDDFVTATQANLVRVEPRADGGKRYVLLDARGPGAVLRMWTATPVGTLRVHVDDQEQPVLEAPMAALLRGDVPPFVAPLAHVTARGHNLYFPIPYRTRCVITTDDIVSPDPFTGKPTAKLYYQ